MADGVVLNGGRKERKLPPAVQIFWDPETLGVAVNFDSDQLKHWMMVKMVLQGAVDRVEHEVRKMEVMAMQQQAQQAMVEQVVKQQVLAAKH